MFKWFFRRFAEPDNTCASTMEGDIPKSVYRETISDTKRGLFDYQISKGVPPKEAFELLAGADYAMASGNFIRTFAAIEVALLAIAMLVDKELCDEYAFSFKPRLKEARKKLIASNASDDDKSILIHHFDRVRDISELRHRIMHWMLEAIPAPGKPYVFINFSNKPRANGTSETASYHREELETAAQQASAALQAMNDFISRRAAMIKKSSNSAS